MERERKELLNSLSAFGDSTIRQMTNFFAPPKDRRRMTIPQLANWMRWSDLSALLQEFNKENPGDEIQ